MRYGLIYGRIFNRDNNDTGTIVINYIGFGMLGGYPIFRQSLILRGYSLKFKAYIDFADLFFFLPRKNSTFGRSHGIANSIPCDQEMQLRQD